MTLKQLQEFIGTLVLVRDEKGNYHRMKLVHVFDLPTGIPESRVCCLVKTPQSGRIIYASSIVYAFPHFNKKIRDYHYSQKTKTSYGYACSAK